MPVSATRKQASDDAIENKICLIRDQRVMLDEDLAALYGVLTMRLNEQVKRNNTRFPEDFMFQLTLEEFESLKKAVQNPGWGGRRKLPYAFTEHGVLMLSSVLNSETAIKVNIQIMRIYIRMRKLFLSNREILHKLEQVEHMVEKHDEQLETVFEHLEELLVPPAAERSPIGFRINA